jgi:hypothetical protein
LAVGTKERERERERERGGGGGGGSVFERLTGGDPVALFGENKERDREKRERDKIKRGVSVI